MSPTLREKLRFIRITAFCILATEGALIGYCEYQGCLDIRVYTSTEQQYHARLHRAEAEIARYAVSGGEDEQTEQPTVWAALDAPAKRKGK